MARAKTKEEYREAWASHVRELIHVFMASGKPMEEWESEKDYLMSIVDAATNHTYDK